MNTFYKKNENISWRKKKFLFLIKEMFLKNIYPHKYVFIFILVGFVSLESIDHLD